MKIAMLFGTSIVLIVASLILWQKYYPREIVKPLSHEIKKHENVWSYELPYEKNEGFSEAKWTWWIMEKGGHNRVELEVNISSRDTEAVTININSNDSTIQFGLSHVVTKISPKQFSQYKSLFYKSVEKNNGKIEEINSSKDTALVNIDSIDDDGNSHVFVMGVKLEGL